jgi:uncharacterized membrane protein YjgN (DUF898 family)
MYKQHTGIDAYPLEFSGSGSEFFRVWIVNVLLTVVTLGLYTPFARRRTAQYFWGHTIVADSPLEFTAQQKKMVIGFLIFAGLYLAFNVASETGQDTTVTVMMFGGAALAPYFWASAMRFRLNATRWRGVRLQFAANWKEVYRASWPVFAIALLWSATAFLLDPLVPDGVGPDGEEVAGFIETWPMVVGVVGVALVLSVLCIIRLEFNYKSLLVARGRIGGQAGRWKPVFGDFVRIWLATVGVFLLSMLAMLLLFVVAGGTLALGADPDSKVGFGYILAMLAAFLLGFAAIFVGSAPARAYRDARMFQLVWNNIGVSRIARFKCDLKVWRYVRLRTFNIVLTLLTLGFYRPFAMVSEYRMKAESVTLHVKGSLDQLAGQLARE